MESDKVQFVILERKQWKDKWSQYGNIGYKNFNDCFRSILSIRKSGHNYGLVAYNINTKKCEPPLYWILDL